ncbi:hypothetical protein Riv7116_6360 [Rivularia sp. PCC 7116]|nr:hypothetical protein Riv7116_6360 [Rivularia sp. PCC 7116]
MGNESKLILDFWILNFGLISNLWWESRGQE